MMHFVLPRFAVFMCATGHMNAHTYHLNPCPPREVRPYNNSDGRFDAAVPEVN